jgi:hypothetical protein
LGRSTERRAPREMLPDWSSGVDVRPIDCGPIPCWKGLSADSEEKREPASDIDTVVAKSLNALDLGWPIREANR